MYPDEYKIDVLPDTGPASKGLVYKFARRTSVGSSLLTSVHKLYK